MSGWLKWQAETVENGARRALWLYGPVCVDGDAGLTLDAISAAGIFATGSARYPSFICGYGITYRHCLSSSSPTTVLAGASALGAPFRLVGIRFFSTLSLKMSSLFM